LAFTWHCTWLVNSAAHMFGYQTYDARDDSRNCWWVALLSFGEGWHNNHHAFPRSARHGLAWWEFDMSYLTLRLLESLGLAWNIRVGDHLRAARGNRTALAA
jgi:stearoyl-CoA desaturase (delta-9 desaturase)